MSNRSPIWFALAVVGVVAIAMAIVAGVLIATEAVNTEGQNPDWEAVTGVAAVFGVLVTAAAVGAVAVAAQEFKRARQETRIAQAPYVRADIAFLGRYADGFNPPESNRTLTLSELRSEVEIEPTMAGLRPQGDDEGYELVLWLTNLQSTPLGIAEAVSTSIDIVWMQNDELLRAEIDLGLRYLGATQTTSVSLGRIASDLPLFVAQVSAVVYRDYVNIYQDTHGAMTVWYNAEGIRNERDIQRATNSQRRQDPTTRRENQGGER